MAQMTDTGLFAYKTEHTPSVGVTLLQEFQVLTSSSLNKRLTVRLIESAQPQFAPMIEKVRIERHLRKEDIAVDIT